MENQNKQKFNPRISLMHAIGSGLFMAGTALARGDDNRKVIGNFIAGCLAGHANDYFSYKRNKKKTPPEDNTE